MLIGLSGKHRVVYHSQFPNHSHITQRDFAVYWTQLPLISTKFVHVF